MSEKRILVADDSLTIQKVIRLALSQDGYEIQTVSDGQEALEQASLFRPHICIIDVSLPKFDAFQLRETFAGIPDLAEIPFILMSSAFEKVDESRMNEMHFSGHLIKPFDPAHLRSTLLQVMEEVEAKQAASEVPPPPPLMDEIQFEPPPPPAPVEEVPEETFPAMQPIQDDVRELTDNTFKLSGFDDGGWGIMEPALTPTPESQPSHAQQHHAPQHQHMAIDDVIPMEPIANSMSEMTDYSNLQPSEPSHQQTFDRSEVEAMVRTEVERVLSQIAAREFPLLAERVIREEIHKLLSNPPV
jgi:CheY-like chemotaxis protein